MMLPLRSILLTLTVSALAITTLAGCEQSDGGDSVSPDTTTSTTNGAAPDAGKPPTTADGKYGVGDRLQPTQQSAEDSANVRTLEWDELIPADYDPMVILEGIDLDKLEDGDPRAQELLDDLKAAWAEAPPVESLDGLRIRLPGFAVPLEGDEKVVTEMLLVPYFGACIHVPPPPSNQIIHILPSQPIDQELLYDAVWVEGTLNVGRSETRSGDAAYSLTATAVTVYE